MVIALLAAPAFAGPPSDLSADLSPWADVPWGAPLPEGLVAERDWPWGASEDARCGWRGDGALLCDDGAGVARAYRVASGPLDAPRGWLRTAGLEWRPGALAEVEADGLLLGGWRPDEPTQPGWDWALRADAPQASGPSAADGAPAPSLVVAIEGGEPLGADLPVVEAALASCVASAGLERMPIQVLYAEDGRSRKVRVQGFPPDGLPMTCVVAAIGEPARPPGVEGSLELMLSLTPR